MKNSFVRARLGAALLAATMGLAMTQRAHAQAQPTLAEANLPSTPTAPPAWSSSPARALNLAEVMATVDYPKMAAEAGIEGLVTISVRTNQEGQLVAHKVLRAPHSLLAEAIVARLPELRFVPATVNGAPTRAWTTLRFNFSLQK